VTKEREEDDNSHMYPPEVENKSFHIKGRE
jgi:hypothetical protein